MHIRRGHNTPYVVYGHVLLVTRVTHPFVTLDKEIVTLQVPIGVRGVTHKP